MAKVRRGLSSIAQGVRNKFKEALKFGSERRSEVLEDLQSDQYDYNVDEYFEEENTIPNENIGRTPLNNPVPPVEDPTPADDVLNQGLDGNMRTLAKNIYKSNKVDETRTMFLLLINNYTRQIRENPANVDELNEKLEIKKSQLDEFDKEITIIRAEEQIVNLVDSTNNLLDEIETDFDQLGEYLEDVPSNYSAIMSLIGKLENKLGDSYPTPTGHMVIGYSSSVSTLAELHIRYKDLTGKNYIIGRSIKFFPENLIRKIYGEIESNIRKNQAIIEKEDTDQKTKEHLNRLVAKLDSLIDYLPNLLKDPLEFDRIQEETNAVLDRVHGERKNIQHTSEPNPQPQPSPSSNENTPSPKKNNSGSTSLFVIMVEQNMKKIYEKVRQLSSQFKASDRELEALVESYRNDIDKVTYLDDEIKRQIIEEAEERYNRKLCQEYGEDVYNFICQYSFDYEEKLEKLNNKTYGTPEFANAYENLMSLINNMIISGRDIGLNIEFNEETQTLNIDFNNEKINKFTSQIVSADIAKTMFDEYNLSEEDQKNHEKSQFAYDMEELFDEFDEEFERIVNELPSISRLPKIDSKINDLINNDLIYPHLTMEDKKEVTRQIENKHWNKLNQRYGENFLWFINSILLPEYGQIDFTSIEKYGLGDEELLSEYSKLTASIDEFKNNIYNNEFSKDIIESIELNENTNILTINYKNPNIPSFHKEIVDQEIANKIVAIKNNGSRRQPQPIPPTPGNGSNGNSTGTGTNPMGTSNPYNSGTIPPSRNNADLRNPSYIAAQEDYINKVNELNNIVEMINDINRRIESQAVFNFLDVNNANSIVSLEEEAQQLDQQLVSLRIELSRDRLNIKKQFNVFVLSVPEVKNIPMNEVEFSGSLNDFIAQRDEMIVEAEERIVELDYERKSNPQNVIVINEEISVLLKFIEAQNSIVGRRLVAECKTNNLNIVDTLKDRREKKKEMRAKLQEIKDYKTVKPQTTINTNVEEEYRSEVIRILKEELQRKIMEARNGGKIVAPSTNLSSEVNQSLFILEGNPKYASINTGKIRIEEIKNLDNAYKKIVEVEQLEIFFSLIDNINYLTTSLTPVDVNNRNLEDILNLRLDTIIRNHSALNNLNYKLELKNNLLFLEFEHKEYDFKIGQYKIEKISKADSKVLSDELMEIYEKAINAPIQEPVSTDDIKKIGLYIIDYCEKFTPIPLGYLVYNMFNLEQLSGENIKSVVENLIASGVVREEQGFLIPLMTKEEFLKNVLGENIEKTEPLNQPIQAQENNPSEVKISTRKLTFNPKNEKQLANKTASLVMEGDSVTISLLKNGIKIKYSQELREKLSKLNAKINLVNKGNYRVRTSETINENEEEQTLEFSDGREITPEDYKIEIRVPDKDKSNVVFEYDLENVNDEIKSRSR